MRYVHAAEGHLDPGVGEDGVEEGGELPVPVRDQEPRLVARVFEVRDGVLRRLCYPKRGGMRCGTQDPDGAARVFDHREYVESGF
jgi:hypothetical protein